jgi:Tfp pilus assembly protein PilO
MMSRLLPIISISLLVLLILGVVFLWWPKYQSFSDLRAELEQKERELEQKRKYFANLEALSKKLEGYPEELTKIESALSVDPSIPALFNFIQKASSENGLILEKLSLAKVSSSPEQQAEIQKISFSVSVSGSYSAFKNFLSVIYKNARLIEVESIKFSSPEGADLFTFDFNLETNSYKEPPSGGQEPGF